MIRYLALITVAAAIAIAIVAFTRTKDKVMRYAIQHVKTGKNLRPYRAGKHDGNRLILYNHHGWKCMTWDFIKIENETYKLQNRYTSKTFQAQGQPAANARLCQHQLNSDIAQEWEFIRQPHETYLIKLKGTELYVSISSEETNSDIILLPLQNSESQQWKLVEQDPWF